jgi:hypothetical protein
MRSPQLRKLDLDGSIYLWRVHHRHLELSSDGERRCSEVFTAFQREFGRRPVRILFPETKEHGSGYPGQRGVVVDYRYPNRHINLNRPRLARLLIELAVRAGWSPAVLAREFVVANGFHLLHSHATELDAALSASA